MYYTLVWRTRRTVLYRSWILQTALRMKISDRKWRSGSGSVQVKPWAVVQNLIQLVINSLVISVFSCISLFLLMNTQLLSSYWTSVGVTWTFLDRQRSFGKRCQCGWDGFENRVSKKTYVIKKHPYPCGWALNMLVWWRTNVHVQHFELHDHHFGPQAKF